MFDAQADTFDRRAGLPPGAVDPIVRALRDLAAPAPGDLFLELGAGTGEIGSALAAAGLRYLGLDLSFGMLRVFRARRAGRALFAQADADRPWPVCPRSVRVIFASRAAHLLSAGRLAEEALAAARPGGALLVLGRVRREPDSLRATLRREMRRLLAAHGFEGRDGEGARRCLFDLLAERGAHPLPPRTAATWPVEERAADSLAAWRAKPGLAGIAVPTEVRLDVLDRLEAWACRLEGGRAGARPARESYELAAIRLP